jgi:hypothetical protein
MRKVILIIVCGLAILAAGCGGGKAVKEETANRGPCMFPDDRVTRAPEWICTRSYPGVEIAAVGSHAKSSAGYEFQKNMAATAARAELAREVKVAIQARITKYASEKALRSVNLDDVSESNESVTKQITNATLTGSRICEVSANPKTGTLFVLVGIDKELAEKLARHAQRGDMLADPSRWKKLEDEAGQGKKDLDPLLNESAGHPKE